MISRRTCIFGLSAAAISTTIPDIAASREDFSTPRTLARSQWSARPARYDPKYVYYDSEDVIEYLVIHHTGTLRGPWTNPTVWQIQDSHMLTKGWLDIGYNEIIAKNAWCYMGRDWRTMAAAVGPSVESKREWRRYGRLIHPELSLNYGTYNICLIGDFTYEKPEDKQEDYLLERVKLLAAKFPNITPEKVIGHKQNQDIADARGVTPSRACITLCPGNIDGIIKKCANVVKDYRQQEAIDVYYSEALI